MGPGPDLQLHLHILPGAGHAVQVLAGRLHLAAVAAIDEEPAGRGQVAAARQVTVAGTKVRPLWASVPPGPPLPSWVMLSLRLPAYKMGITVAFPIWGYDNIKRDNAQEALSTGQIISAQCSFT